MRKNEQDKLSRRKFLGVGAVGATAVVTAGISGCDNNTDEACSDRDASLDNECEQEQVSWDETFDVVVVGAGGAGLVAAIEASQAGASVLVLEKTSKIGGSTAMSGGVIQASDTEIQSSFGITGDTSEKHSQYWIEAGEGMVNPDLVTLLANNSGKDIKWLADLGVSFNRVYGVDPIPYIDPDLMMARLHVVAGKGGAYISTLKSAAEEAGSDIRTDIQVISLVQDANKETVGVKALVDENDTYFKADKGVILASGGFDRNDEMAQSYSPQLYLDLQDKKMISPKNNTGDGIKMGMTIGADLAGMGGTIVHFAGTAGRRSDTQLEIPGIWVNKYGQRFVNEASHYGYACRAVFSQEEHIAWSIFDENAKEIGGLTITDTQIETGVAKIADTMEELALAIGVNAYQLVTTINKWNDDMAQGGEDTLFGKAVCLQPLNTPPFYARRVERFNIGSCGGLKINTDAQVLDMDGTVLKRLYAAGMVSGGFIGPYYPGSGTAVTATLVFGRIAGQQAAQEK